MGDLLDEITGDVQSADKESQDLHRESATRGAPQSKSVGKASIQLGASPLIHGNPQKPAPQIIHSFFRMWDSNHHHHHQISNPNRTAEKNFPLPPPPALLHWSVPRSSTSNMELLHCSVPRSSTSNMGSSTEPTNPKAANQTTIFANLSRRARVCSSGSAPSQNPRSPLSQKWEGGAGGYWCSETCC